MNSTERNLFVSIWILIALALALWIFWPSVEQESAAPPEVTLHESMEPFFDKITKIETSPKKLLIELHLTPQLSKRAQLPNSFQLGYKIYSDALSTIRGNVATKNMNHETLSITIDTGTRLNLKRVELFLAR